MAEFSDSGRFRRRTASVSNGGESDDEGCNAAFMLPRDAVGEGLTRGRN
jgi:hypothetical protein